MFFMPLGASQPMSLWAVLQVPQDNFTIAQSPVARRTQNVRNTRVNTSWSRLGFLRTGLGDL